MIWNRSWNYPVRRRYYITPELNQSIIVPKADIFEDEKHIYFEFEMPGIKKEDISVKINDDKELMVKAKRYLRNDEAQNDEDRKFHEFKRTFKLEGEYEEDINARYNDGILYLQIPKRLPVEKEISIN
jgi:HSP20 family protein